MIKQVALFRQDTAAAVQVGKEEAEKKLRMENIYVKQNQKDVTSNIFGAVLMALVLWALCERFSK